jgi:hypothetical protein
MSANRYLSAAQAVAEAIPGLLASQGLDPLISRNVLTETERGDAWLFVVMMTAYRDSSNHTPRPVCWTIFLLH